MAVNFRGCTPYVLRTQRCYQVLYTCLHSKANLSMISSSIRATKEGRQHAKPPWLPGTDLRLNTEANKLESVVYMCKVIAERVTMITYLLVIKNFEGAEEDGDSVAETNLPDILTCNGLIFMGKEHTTKSTKIYTPRKFLRVQYQ